MKSFADLVRVRNLETGAIGRIARRLFDNPKINPGILVEVDDKAKPYVPSMYKSKMPIDELGPVATKALESSLSSQIELRDPKNEDAVKDVPNDTKEEDVTDA